MSPRTQARVTGACPFSPGSTLTRKWRSPSRISLGMDGCPASRRGQRRNQLLDPLPDHLGERPPDQPREGLVAADDPVGAAGEADRVADEIERGGPLAGRRPDLALRPAGPEQRAQRRQQLARVHRMRQVAVGAAVQPFRLGVGRGEAGRDVHHLDVAGGGIALEPAADLEAVDVRQTDVERDQLGALALGQAESVQARRRLDHVEARLAQDAGQVVALRVVVVHHQDRGDRLRHAGSPRSPAGRRRTGGARRTGPGW